PPTTVRCSASTAPRCTARCGWARPTASPGGWSRRSARWADGPEPWTSYATSLTCNYGRTTRPGASTRTSTHGGRHEHGGSTRGAPGRSGRHGDRAPGADGRPGEDEGDGGPARRPESDPLRPPLARRARHAGAHGQPGPAEHGLPADDARPVGGRPGPAAVVPGPLPGQRPRG